MKLMFKSVRYNRGDWSLFADGTFHKGVHLITGVVGSGKSTLALILAGLAQPQSGSIIRENIPRGMISFQFPEYHVTGSTVSEECRSWGLDPAVITGNVTLSRKMDVPPLQLSRGELKRLHLACVLAGTYELLVLDEPFSSLDCCEKERICSEISRRQSGITIIFTHEQAIFPQVDFLWQIDHNQLRYLGEVPEALSQWNLAPPVIKKLIEAGKTPKNISLQDIREAACRI